MSLGKKCFRSDLGKDEKSGVSQWGQGRGLLGGNIVRDKKEGRSGKVVKKAVKTVLP